MAEVDGGVNGAEFLVIEPEGVADRSVRAGVHYRADGVPAEIGALGAELNAADLRKIGERLHRAGDGGVCQRGEVKVLLAVGEHLTVGKRHGVFYLDVRVSLRPLVNFIDAAAAAEVSLLQLRQLIEQGGLAAFKRYREVCRALDLHRSGLKFHGLCGKERGDGVTAGCKEQKGCGKADDAENFFELSHRMISSEKGLRGASVRADAKAVVPVIGKVLLMVAKLVA